MHTPLTGHWTHIQSPASQIMKDSFKGLLTTISVGLTIAACLSIVILTLILTSTVANAAKTDALSNAKSGSLLVKNAQTGEYMPTPTLATDVNISVSGILSRTKVSQKFQNNSKDWV